MNTKDKIMKQRMCTRVFNFLTVTRGDVNTIKEIWNAPKLAYNKQNAFFFDTGADRWPLLFSIYLYSFFFFLLEFLFLYL